MFYCRRIVSFTTLTLTLLIVAFPSTNVGADEPRSRYHKRAPEQTFPTSLHGTRLGKLTFYSKHLGGLETLTNKSMEELGCLQCHHSSGKRADGTPIDPASYKPSCADCHDSRRGDPGPVDPKICLECHGRQARELQQALPDVHRDAGLTCTNCHTKREMHGDGNVYSSMLAPGAKAIV